MISSKSKKRKLSPISKEDQNDPDYARGVNETTIMDLPKELLSEIINYTLIKPNPITLRKPHEYRWAKELQSLRPHPSPNDPKRRRTCRSNLLKILLVNHDFYFAGLEAYYSNNTFHFDTPFDFRETFIKTLTDRHKSCIKRLVIDWDWYFIEQERTKVMGYFPHWAWALERDVLEGFPKVESCVVNCTMDREPVYFAAASRAREAKTQIRAIVLKAWPSKAEKLEFVFPKSWGRLADM